MNAKLIPQRFKVLSILVNRKKELEQRMMTQTEPSYGKRAYLMCHMVLNIYEMPYRGIIYKKKNVNATKAMPACPTQIINS